MCKIAANISLLFRELPLLERFQAARAAGFDGVELQFPYDESARELAGAAERAAAPVVLINAPISAQYPAGLAGRPEMREFFRSTVPQIVEYADALNVRFVHVLAGHILPTDERERCWNTYAENLRRAADALQPYGIGVLVEPLNPLDVPHYLVGTLAAGILVLDRCEHRVGLQFDAYHVARMGLDPAVELQRLMPLVRHVQFADAPGRHEPGTGSIGFDPFLEVLNSRGYEGWVSAEYVPATDTTAGLGWMAAWRSAEAQRSIRRSSRS
jgi:hydroxypyruvate isomerase